jgi:hypothetical protein
MCNDLNITLFMYKAKKPPQLAEASSFKRLNLVAVVSKRFVGFSHTMGFITLLHGGTTT